MGLLRWLSVLSALGGVAIGVAMVANGTGNRSAAAAGLVSAVSAGSGHTCALTTAGSVLCWGSNHKGQIGDGGMCNNACTRPASVPGLGGGVGSISAGDFHTCAASTAGVVACWGANDHGQLGDGTTSLREVPTIMGMSSKVASVSAGDLHTCAVTTGGGVKCWGSNENGQLGDDRGCGDLCTAPVDVPGLTDRIAAVSAGGGHTCALTTMGGAKCWGYGTMGALGDGLASSHATPVDVVGLGKGIARISAGGSHTCALTLEGGVLCWGDNESGQLGDGTTVSRPTPVTVSGLTSGVMAISAGDHHTCALTTQGDVRCWGLEVWGPVSEGAFVISTTPGPILDGGTGNTLISAGDYHNCVVTLSGGLKCWGHNGYGQLGTGNTVTRSSAQDVMDIGPGNVKPTPPPTFTPTNTTEPTATEMPTATATLTATHTPSETPTPSATLMATDTPTAISTPTHTPTVRTRLRNGDADGSGEIDVVDAALVVQFLAGLLPSVSAAADANADGEVDAVDAALILQYVAGLIADFP